jgi:bacterioferritin (cytochrome b1)
MQATLPGLNRTGTTASPEGAQAMTEAVNELMPPVPVDTAALEAERLLYIDQSDTVGSIPPPLGLGGMVKSGMARLKGANPGVLMDKVGERLAFERGGVRMYEALLAKYEGATRRAGEVLPRADQVQEVAEAQGLAVLAPVAGESPEETLRRIRGEELAHFQLLCEAMTQLGGDPTAQTPCADVVTTASAGILQVLTDPRTTLAQCLNAILTIELTDNAGWELLVQLAEQAGESELAGRFLGALAQEQEHLVTIKGWLAALVTQGGGTPAV